MEKKGNSGAGFCFTGGIKVCFISGFPTKQTMSKTRKALAKRFKVTGSGKVLRRKAGHRHLLRNRSAKQRRAQRQDQSVGRGMAREVKRGASAIF